jgi:hypothetical protein
MNVKYKSTNYHEHSYDIDNGIVVYGVDSILFALKVLIVFQLTKLNTIL